jgi:hypothetical protein
MLLSNTLTYAVAFVAALPAATAEYAYNSQTHLRDIGQVPLRGDSDWQTVEWM